MKSLLEKFSLNSGQNYYAIKTFTYFVPAPTQRQNGYREKELDKIVYELTQYGHAVLNIQTQAISTSETSGMWIIFLLGALNKEAAKLDLDFHEKFGLAQHSNDSDIVLDN